MMTAVPLPMQRPAMQTDRACLQYTRIRSEAKLHANAKELSWDREFQTRETMLNAYVVPVAEPAVQSASKPAPKGQMAELAARVIDAVKDEQNPKFQQSQFMSLMRQFRDGEVVVDDNKIVPSESSTIRVDVKGKGRAVDIPVREVHQPATVHPVPASSAQAYQGSIELNEAYRHQHKDTDEAYFQRENEEFSEYWDAHYTGPVPNTVPAGVRGSWHELQEAWDALEATSTGIKPLVNYQFQANNPYLLGDSSRTHQLHMSQAQRLYDVSCKMAFGPITIRLTQFITQSVLELEAVVQRDPNNAAAWFELGVKQQENEREAKAIQALERSVELDPSLLSAWLALSVSYTNDNNRTGVYNAIKEWVLRNSKYPRITQTADLNTANVSSPGDFGALIQCLIGMARSADEVGGVDADVQVALAVLLNTTEVRAYCLTPYFHHFSFVPCVMAINDAVPLGIYESARLFLDGIGGSPRC